MKKETFILKKSYGSVFNGLSDRQAGVLIKAVFEYIATGGIPAGLNDGEIKMALKFICQDIESFSKSYQDRCETNRRNGEKGGAPKGNQNAKRKDVTENEKTTETTEKTERLKNNPNDNDNDLKEISPDGDIKKAREESGFEKFNGWIAENAPYCFKNMKQITGKEFEKLKEKYTSRQITQVILQIENRKDLRKKYSNLYRTALNWLKNEEKGK
jgi:hypothetical protein